LRGRGWGGGYLYNKFYVSTFNPYVYLFKYVAMKVEVTEGANKEVEVEAVGQVAGFAQLVHC
jgi:hypothetical protein